MMEQIWKLSKVQLCNLYGLNEIRYTKDKGKRGRYIGVASVWMLLIIMMICYITILSSVFVKMNMAQIIPIYLFALTSLLILFFTFFKVGSIIFQMNTYELMISLPVSKAAIVISRFVTLYVTNLMMGLIIMLPGTIIFSIFARPGFLFYVCSLIGILFLPMLPLSIATGIGAGITAISARMKSKSLVASLLTVGISVAIVILCCIPGGAEKMTEEMLLNLAGTIADNIGKIYPPAIWFSNAVVSGDIGSMLLLIMVSLTAFLILTFILQHYFLSICSALNATSAKNNYKMQSLSTNSVRTALWKKEIKRYFASSIYVANTMIGYVLMAAMCIALFIVGPVKLEKMMQIPHIIVKAMPFIMSMMCILAPTTASSISMEGKQWTITKSLPISSRDLFSSKILMNLTIALPFYIISTAFSILALKPDLLDAIWLIVIPAVYIIFIAEVGITINLTFPIFNWENEVRVVKQSMSMLITMLIGFVAAGIPFGLAMKLSLIGTQIIVNNKAVEVTNTIKTENIGDSPLYPVVMISTILILAVISVVLHIKNNKKDLIKIG